MATILTMQQLAEVEDLDLGTTEWWTVDQELVDGFADATRDHQWIHVDPARAADGPFGTTIAHGMLTAALVPGMFTELLDVSDATMGVNYGFDRLRLTAPVPVGTRVRGLVRLIGAEPRGEGLLLRAAVTVELEGSERPALVATFLALQY